MASNTRRYYCVAVLAGDLNEFIAWGKTRNTRPLQKESDTCFIDSYNHIYLRFYFIGYQDSIRGRVFCRHLIWGNYWKTNREAQKIYDEVINRTRALTEIPESYWQEMERY